MPRYGLSRSERDRWAGAAAAAGWGSGDQGEANAAARRTVGGATVQVGDQLARSQLESNMRIAQAALDRMEAQGIDSGGDYELLTQYATTGQEQKGNWFTRMLSWLDRPGQLVRYGIADIFDIGEGENITGQAYADILQGRTGSLLQRYGAETVGEDARMSGSQLLNLAGLEEATTGWGRFGRGLLSVGLEIGTDPLSYLATGAMGMSRPALMNGLRETISRYADDGMRLFRAGRVRGAVVDKAEQAAARFADDMAEEMPRARHLVEEELFNTLTDPAAARASGATIRGVQLRGFTLPGETVAPAARLAGLEAEAEALAFRTVKEAHLNAAAPSVLARDWANPTLADIVVSKHAPAFLRGGIHLSPLPVLWNVPEHALTIPGTRGTGKWVSRHLFGRAAIAGQDASGARKLVDTVFPNLSKAVTELGRRTDARSYIRGVLLGEVKASTVMSTERAVRSAEVRWGAKASLEAIQRGLIDLVAAGQKAGWSVKQVEDVFARVPARLLQTLPADRQAARAEVADILRAALGGVDVPPEIVEGMVEFVGVHRQVFEKSHRWMVDWGLVEKGQKLDDYVPVVMTPEMRQLRAEMARGGVAIPLDTPEGQLLAEFVYSYVPPGSTTLAAGEASHAGERTFGAFSVPLGEGSDVVHLDLKGLDLWLQANPGLEGGALYNSVRATLAAAGAPRMALIDDLNSRLGAVLAKVVEATHGLKMPKMKGAAQFRLFDTNPVSMTASYLVDVHKAIVERAVLQHLDDIGELPPALRAVHKARTSAAYARMVREKDPQHLANLNRMIEKMGKEQERAALKAGQRVTIWAGNRGWEIPAGAASEQVRDWFRRRLGVLSDLDLAVRTSEDRAMALRHSLVDLGIDDETAGILSLARSTDEAQQIVGEMLAELSDSADRTVRELVRAVQSSGGGLQEAADRVAELAAVDAAERADLRAVGNTLTRRFRRRRTVDVRPLTAEQVMGAAEQVGETLARAQRAAKLLPGGRVKRDLVEATARLIPAFHAGDQAGIREAAGLLDAALARLEAARQAGNVWAVGEMAASAVRRFAARGSLPKGQADVLLDLADRLAVAEPGEVWNLLEGAAGTLPDRVVEDIAASTLLAHGVADPDAFRIVGEGAPNLAVLADLQSLRAQAEAMGWVAAARQSVLTGRGTVRQPMWDGARLERGLRDLFGMPDDVAVTWQRVAILDGEGRVAQVWGPKFTEVVGRSGISRDDLAGELAAAGLTGDQARRGLLSGDPQHAAVRLGPEAKKALLASSDETVAMLDDWAERMADSARRRLLAAGGPSGNVDWAAGRAALFEQMPFEAGERRWRELLRSRRGMPAAARLGQPTDSALEGIRQRMGSTVGDLVAEPSKVQMRGGRVFATEDGAAGFGISQDGEVFSLFSVGEPGGGVAALYRARQEGATWASIPKGNDEAAALFGRMGFTDQIVQADGTIRVALPGATQAGRAAADHAAAMAAVERVARLVGRGLWREADGVLANQATRRLLRAQGFGGQVDLLRLQVRARQMLDDPLVDRQVKEVVRARTALLGTALRPGLEGRADAAGIAMSDMAELIARERVSPELARSAVAREWLTHAEGLRRLWEELTGALREGLPIATEAAEIKYLKTLTGQVLAEAKAAGFNTFRRGVAGVGKGGLERTILPATGGVLVKAFSLAGEQVQFSSPNKWVAEMIESMVGHLQSLNTPVGLEFLGHQTRAIIGWWKGMATVVRPTFHVRNLIGAVFNNMIGGVRVRDYIWVRDKLARFRHYEGRIGTEAALARMGAEDASVIRDMLETGVLESSFARADRNILGSRPSLPQRLNPLSQHGPAVRVGGEVMTTIEDFVRAAAFKRWYGSGRDLAAEMTFGLHFDYTRLTPLETQIKKIVPFYVWTRRNLPLQLRALVERPDLVQRYAHLMHGMNDQYEANAPFDLPLPGLYSNALSIGTGLTFNGDTPFWARAIVSPDLPLMDLGKIDPLSPKSWLDFVASTMGPQITAPFELAQQAEYGGSVNAPAGLNEILMALHAMGMYDDVSGGVAQVPRELRSLMEMGLPMWREWTAPWETDPARRQALGLGQERDILSADVLRAMGITLARGLGMRTVTPTQTYNESWKGQEDIQDLVRQLQRRGVIPPPS